MTIPARVTLVMCVFNQLALTRACLASLATTRQPFALVVVDNGSTDATPEFFRSLEAPFPVRYERSETNRPVIAQLNRGWRMAETEVVCILHNDTEMIEPGWLGRLLDALDAPGVGLAGLYGVKRLRRDGRFVGRTIVHSLAEGPTVRAPWEEVVVVDSVCMTLRRDLMSAVGGFDEGYGFYHGLDRDLSMAVRETGRRCVIVHAPFRHRGGGTRARDFGRRPEQERDDLALRRAVLERFAGKWRHRLPCDVRPVPLRVRDWVTAKIGV
jgi:GT2 family glycosyltransferase